MMDDINKHKAEFGVPENFSTTTRFGFELSSDERKQAHAWLEQDDNWELFARIPNDDFVEVAIRENVAALIISSHREGVQPVDPVGDVLCILRKMVKIKLNTITTKSVPDCVVNEAAVRLQMAALYYINRNHQDILIRMGCYIIPVLPDFYMKLMDEKVENDAKN